MDFLKWMFGSFWRFIGVLILLGVILSGISDGLLALRGKSDTTCPNNLEVHS